MFICGLFYDSAEDRAKVPAQQGDNRVARRICLRIRKGSFSILHNYPKRKAFFASGQALALVQVEYPYFANDFGLLG